MGDFLRERLPEPVAYYEGEGLTLKGLGKWRSALCVFHDERSPSLRINTVDGGFACMGCGVRGGDVLAFHMERHGLDFIAAARQLGAWHEDDKAYAGPRRARKLPAADALELLYQDALLVWVAAGNLRQGVDLTDHDFADLGAAEKRIWLVSQEARA